MSPTRICNRQYDQCPAQSLRQHFPAAHSTTSGQYCVGFLPMADFVLGLSLLTPCCALQVPCQLSSGLALCMAMKAMPARNCDSGSKQLSETSQGLTVCCPHIRAGEQSRSSSQALMSRASASLPTLTLTPPGLPFYGRRHVTQAHNHDILSLMSTQTDQPLLDETRS